MEEPATAIAAPSNAAPDALPEEEEEDAAATVAAPELVVSAAPVPPDSATRNSTTPATSSTPFKDISNRRAATGSRRHRVAVSTMPPTSAGSAISQSVMAPPSGSP